MKYLIWYNSIAGVYNWGDKQAFELASSNSPDNSILAEEFINTSSRIVEKITAKLNTNLMLISNSK